MNIIYMAELNSTKNIITLYHGSTFLFNEIDTLKGKPYKDFGIGFYTTKHREHAVNLALRNRKIEEFRLQQQKIVKNVFAYLYTYEIDANKLSNLSVKEFKIADKDWMQFVLENRRSKEKNHMYDIVIGPTADDDTRLSIRAYFAGAYGEIDSDIAIESLIGQIQSDNLPPQFYFANNKVTSLLTPKGEVIIL